MSDNASRHGVAQRCPEPLSQRCPQLHPGPHQVQRQQKKQSKDGSLPSVMLTE